jgi:hypothetical protein
MLTGAGQHTHQFGEGDARMESASLNSCRDDEYHCSKCGSSDFDALVQGRSYLLRCRSCREIDVATSWIAIGKEWNWFVRVFRDGELHGDPLLEGIGSELIDEIEELSADGTTLILMGEEGAEG